MREGVWQCAGWMETVFEYSRNHNRSVCRVAIHISGDDSFFDWKHGCIRVYVCWNESAKSKGVSGQGFLCLLPLL